MARLRLLVTAVLAVSALAVLAVPASASVPAANSAKFCKSLSTLSNKLSNANPSDLSGDRTVLKKYAADLRSAAKDAPSSVRKATNTLASFYQALGSGNTAALAKSKNIGTAAVKLSEYLSTHCTTATT